MKDEAASLRKDLDAARVTLAGVREEMARIVAERGTIWEGLMVPAEMGTYPVDTPEPGATLRVVRKRPAGALTPPALARG